MVFKVRRSVYRWRRRRNSRKSKKSLPPANIETKLSLQFGSQSARETTPLGSQDYETVPIFRQIFITRKKEIEKDVRIFGKFDKLPKIKINIGPGSHDIIQWPEIILNKTGSSVKKNLGFGTTPRFFTTPKFATPGPGYVGINHNPYYFLENKKRRGLATFEYDGLAPRIPKIKSFSLAPNRYQVKHPDCLDNFLKKKTGKRGPYDLFTGPRDYSSVKGYFTAPEIFEHSDWPKNLPGEIEKLLHSSNHFKGVFGKSPRFPKSSTETILGPGYYELENPKRPKILKNCPFGKSLAKETKLGSKEIRPCPGQYDPKFEKLIQGSGWSWVFKSKLPRTKSLAKESYKSF